MSKYICFILLFGVVMQVSAQRHEIFDENIASLQVVANSDWQSLPLIQLGKGFVNVSFDDLTHEYHRYMYRLQHCDADWSVSEDLFESEYCEGFASGNTIDDVKESLLTNQLYTHYSLQLPNNRCNITMSGNYKLVVYDDNNYEKPILSACFMVAENVMGVGLNVSSNTDVSINQQHQQVAMELNYNGINVNNPYTQIKTVVLQNSRWDDARWNAPPQYIMQTGLKWEHNRSLIFNAGNEYRKFEILSTDVASMGIEKIRWDGEEFHAYPFVSLPRQNYIYDEDANGAFLLRNSDNADSEFMSDYMNVHFILQSPQRFDSEVYVNGNFTHDSFLPAYRMKYDDATQTYEAIVKLKLGYYSYQFLLVDSQGRVHTVPSEGSFYQTENTYQALVYYREQGGRTDRLVGYRQVSSRQ